MINKRVDEATINASLDAYLHGAKEGDPNQARQLHEMLDLMLTERDSPQGQMWLTDHGKMVLAEMHRQLSLCEGAGDHLKETVLDAVRFTPGKHHWDDTCSFVRDLRIALAVANELCEERSSDTGPEISLAAKAVAERGEFDLDAATINEIYDEIASTVGGFKEISRCH